MKGIITKVHSYYPYATVHGDDGIDYFLHCADYDRKSIKKNYIVEFDIVDEGKEKLKAVNARFVGYGKSHPVCVVAMNLCKYIIDNTEPSEEREYRLRDIEMLYRFYAKEEGNSCKNIKDYRPSVFTLIDKQGECD